MRTTLIVTKKGSEMKSNKWKEGQEIECSNTLADLFIKRGIATKDGEQPIVEEPAVEFKKHKKK